MAVSRSASIALVTTLIAGATFVVIACGGGDGTATSTPAPPATSTVAAATTTAAASPAPSASASGTASTAVDPCTLRMSLEGQALTQGVAFSLDPQTKWQLCLGGAAAGSSEKYLYHTTDGGATWTLISETTLGVMTPEANVGAFPNGNGVDVMIFLDANTGWIGLTSPGQNLFRSKDGGVTWTANTDLPPGLPVTSITFSSATNGSLQTPSGPWHTTDAGDHWVSGP